MEFGIYVPWRQLSAGTPAAEMANLLEVARQAEAMEFTALGLPDHVAIPAEEVRWLGGRWYDQMVALGAVAAVTRRIRLVTAVLVAPYHHPLRIAKSVATLDAVSGGRAVLGLGSGYLEGEFAALGVPYRQRGPRTDEAIQAIQAAWSAGASGTPAAHAGRFYPFEGVVSDPAPVQGRVPLWIAGNGAGVIRRAARYGDAWHPIRLTPSRIAGAAAQLQDGRKEGRPAVIPMSHYVRFGTRREEPSGDEGLLTGPPDAVAADLREYAAIGVPLMMLRFDVATTGELLAAMETFTVAVRPQCG